jgi:hypothetical protein
LALIGWILKVAMHGVTSMETARLSWIVRIGLSIRGAGNAALTPQRRGLRR